MILSMKGNLPMEKNLAMEKSLPLLLLVFLLLSVFPGVSFSASQGNFLDLFPDTPTQTFFVALLQADYQENTFAEQRDRKPETDGSGYERHFSESRSSSANFSYSGIKAGMAPRGLPLFYVTAGVATVDLDFSFSDELTPNKMTYSTHLSMDSDTFPVFGAGVCARIYRTQMFENKHFNLGLDLNYRFLDFDISQNQGEKQIEYQSQLHEVQLSLEGSIDSIAWNPLSWLKLVFSPHLGFKISHFIGDETYLDPTNIDNAGNPDPIEYNGDLDVSNHISFFVGTGIKLTQSMTMTVETRSGDEDGYALNLIYTF